MPATKTVSSKAAEWSRVFPGEVTASATSSGTFLKQLTVVAVSCVAYLRRLLPADSFALERFAGARLRVLRRRCTDARAQFLSDALTHAFDAFDKQYLHRLVLCLYDTECREENLVEYHMFEYAYGADAGVRLSSGGSSASGGGEDGGQGERVFSFEDVRTRTENLIHACMYIIDKFAAPPPENYDVSIRLYYNEDAPEQYQAPGYAPGAEARDPLAPALARALLVGRVATPFHDLTLLSYLREPLPSSHEANASLNSPELTQYEPDEFQSGSGSPAPVRCACPSAEYEPGAMLTCQYCHTLQHAACFGLWAESEDEGGEGGSEGGQGVEAAEHCCSECAGSGPARRATDPGLTSMSTTMRQSKCVFRRVAAWLRGRSAVEAAALCARFALRPAAAAKLMRMLHQRRVIWMDNDLDVVRPRAVQAGALRGVLRQLRAPLVARLLEETLSQPPPDPAPHALHLHKESLQAAAMVCTRVEAVPEDAEGAGDAVMERYRAALGRSPSPRGLTPPELPTPLPSPPAPVKRRAAINTYKDSKKTKKTTRG